jgi:hypothetical protein
MTHNKYFVAIYLFVVILMLFLVSCTPANPVQQIKLFHTADGSPPSYVPVLSYTNPSPDETLSLGPGDKIFLFIVLDENFKGDITFSKITFFNRAANQEVEAGASLDLGPFTPGDIFDEICYAPAQPGGYETRIYVANKVTARALFEVK